MYCLVGCGVVRFLYGGWVCVFGNYFNSMNWALVEVSGVFGVFVVVEFVVVVFVEFDNGVFRVGIVVVVIFEVVIVG